MGAHFVSESCEDRKCKCGSAATHKVGEEILHDDPEPNRHNLTAYVCCYCFRSVFGSASPCETPKPVESDGMGWRDVVERNDS